MAVISIIMPVYNGEMYISEAVQSILNQTYTNFELLIINDGSTDQTEEIINGFNDSRIRYIKNPHNLKLIATLNKGLAMATGKYIARMDADDISLPNRLQRQYDFMEANPDVAICGTGYQTLNSEDKLRNPENHTEIMVGMLNGCPIAHPTVMLRADVLKENNYYYDEKFLHAEDYELWYRIGQHYILANLSEILLYYRKHENSIGSVYSLLQKENDLNIKQLQYENLLKRPLNSREKEAFCELNLNEPIEFKSFEIINALLIDLFFSNEKNSVLDGNLFADFLVEKWVNCFLRVGSFKPGLVKMYIENPLHQRISSTKGISIRYIISLSVKSIFKHKIYGN